MHAHTQSHHHKQSFKCANRKGGIYEHLESCSRKSMLVYTCTHTHTAGFVQTKHIVIQLFVQVVCFVLLDLVGTDKNIHIHLMQGLNNISKVKSQQI